VEEGVEERAVERRDGTPAGPSDSEAIGGVGGKLCDQTKSKIMRYYAILCDIMRWYVILCASHNLPPVIACVLRIVWVGKCMKEWIREGFFFATCDSEIGKGWGLVPTQLLSYTFGGCPRLKKTFDGFA